MDNYIFKWIIYILFSLYLFISIYIYIIDYIIDENTNINQYKQV